MPLSERLKAVEMLITPGLTVADVGCDHGYLAIHLIKEGISPHVIAMDINKGPLERAREHVWAAGLNDDIELRLSDGLDELKNGEAGCVVMAGMGGRLMTDIMTRGKEVLSRVKEVILQPQSEVEYVRHFLEDNGYRIISEDIVYEDSKFYPMMKTVHGDMSLKEDIYYKFGCILLKEEHPVLRMFLLSERERLEAVKAELDKAPSTDRVDEGLAKVQKELETINNALEFCEGTNPVTIERVIK
ncbi:MAG: class I SAM-dependent methyltransferase [Lachnospiraceae bacterium]|nr:class I SAM-dependent methyltransferase [Lachnospiraceae bacterium]